MPSALWALVIGAFGIGMTEFTIAGILPGIATEFGTTIPQAGLMVTVYALGVFVGAPVLTILGAGMPRKALLLALACIFTIGNLVTALAPSLSIALVGRVITSFNHGAFFGVGALVAMLLVPPHKRAQAIAFMFSGLTVANLVGVPLGTWLAHVTNWRVVFFVITGIGVVMIASLAVLLPHLEKGARPRISTELRAFADPQVLLAMGITVLGPAGFFTAITYIAPLAIEVAGYSEQGVALLMVLFGLGLVIGNWLGGRFADRSLYMTLYVSLALQGISLIILWLWADSAIILGLMVFLMAAFGFATVSPIQKLVMDRANAAGASTLVASVNIGMFNLGNALGAWLGGVTITAGYGLASPGWTGAILSFVALGLAGLSALAARQDAHARAAAG